MSKNEPMTITEFLEARIAEDETTAKGMTDDDISSSIWFAQNDGALTGDEAREQSDFADRFNAARVLAECAAKRAIIADCRVSTLDDLDCGEDDSPAPLWVARALAAVYKDHPDYQQEWAL